MKQILDKIHRRFTEGFAAVADPQDGHNPRRIGAELKFALVNADATAASRETVAELWPYLADRGWDLVHDGLTGAPSGARVAGEQNDSVASCETGYCKTEFSLAHMADLNAVEKQVSSLRELLQPFAEERGVFFLGFGTLPGTPPSAKLVAKKGRASFWDRVFPSNHFIAPEDGDDVHLFTVNVASHVHVSVAELEAFEAVNVLNGFVPAQIALMANSSVWKGQYDPDYKCVAEIFWDMWEAAKQRAGMPLKPFENSRDYARHVAELAPVYVKRYGTPIILKNYDSFLDYAADGSAWGYDPNEERVPLEPSMKDLDTHNSCYWYNARISRYYTVENRVCDQQPPEDLLCPAALTLGLVEARKEAWEELEAYDWNLLRTARVEACKKGINARANGFAVSR
ncbi:MAG: glutamate-cysteine ligase family protein, partial [Candidatus Hydrogenedentes bacterium]|nr:glutamate-cysteine ligase family protein [Candidatus Hydrogenedentota bacterium]